MMHKATASFWVHFNRLPENVQLVARKNFALLKENPKYPSLHFKKLGKVWSVRIGLNHRALAIDLDGVYIWHWIGSHADYDEMIK